MACSTSCNHFPEYFYFFGKRTLHFHQIVLLNAFEHIGTRKMHGAMNELCFPVESYMPKLGRARHKVCSYNVGLNSFT